MTINKNNYEAFFLDYHEGNLSPQQVADLFLFLSQYPELKKEFEDFEHIVLEDFSAPVFEDKEALKKNITAANREEYFIRAVENMLDVHELTLLDKFLNLHPEFLAEFNLFRKTKLKADAAVVFENKSTIKQLTSTDELLISDLEGLLSPKEKKLFENKLATNPELKKSASLYQQTKSIPDLAVVYPHKQSLKQKEKNVIPIYYSIAVAASLILLIGMFFLWRTNTSTIEQPVAIQEPAKSKQIQPVQEQAKEFAQSSEVHETGKKSSISSPVIAYVKNKKTVVKKSSEQIPSSTKSTIETVTTPAIEPIQVIENSIASVNPDQEKKNELNLSDSSELAQSKNTSPAIAKIERKQEVVKIPYTSLRDILTVKLKEKLVGKDETLAEQNHKNINGWDIAGAFANGLTRITGKKIEVKPQYNSSGNVTAYAFSAGKLEFSRVK